MITSLLIGDTVSLALSGALAILMKLILTGKMDSVTVHSYLTLIPLLPVFLTVYGAIGLYSGVSLGSPEELRRLTLSTTLVSLLLAVLTLSIRGTGTIFTWTMGMALIFSIILVPLIRVCVRMKFGTADWWGYPTVVFGDKENVASLINSLSTEIGIGLTPVAVFTPGDDRWAAPGNVRTLAINELDHLARQINGPAYAVLTGTGSTREELDAVIRTYRKYFSHILVVPGFHGFSCLWVNPRNLGGMLGLEVCQQVFLPSRQLIKRIIDLTLTIGGLILLAPVMVAVALAIKIDSRGPVFYGQRRIGRGGREFRAWKFRSMISSADAVLKKYLEENPALRDEWDRSHKLKDDPRVTALGRFIRRTSLDELPQLWNVIRGEMSLVGPRPIVKDEIRHYGLDFETYTYVQGGLTGLWQVSGRSETSYEQRVSFDRFYVQNWSVWLDLCILFRTIGTVLSRAGAF
jgi:Undecaprenyl-phosphate galactose phosphotransferase WbaP